MLLLVGIYFRFFTISKYLRIVTFRFQFNGVMPRDGVWLCTFQFLQATAY